MITSTPGKDDNNTFFYTSGDYFDSTSDGSYGWICGLAGEPNCDVQAKKKSPDNWKVNGYEIEYCLSQLVKPHCKLQFSLS